MLNKSCVHNEDELTLNKKSFCCFFTQNPKAPDQNPKAEGLSL